MFGCEFDRALLSVFPGALPGVVAVRSAGYLTAARLRMWAQFSTYVAGPEHPGMGRLLHHSLYVITQRRTQLRDITSISDTVHTSFGALIDTRC